ncbi:MAG TPA: peptidase [Magnetospirillaceae bacterium]|jgi:putative proteasome-type protease
MTYCVGVLLDGGLIMASDSRTNAGVDVIATYRKMTIWQKPDHYVVSILSAGNLSFTQSTISLVEEWNGSGDEDRDIGMAKTMYRVARIVGEAMREVQKVDGASMAQHNTDFTATLILGGQIKGERPRLFHLYTPGNFIEAAPDTPFFQAGEIKYGRPVFDRILKFGMPIEQAAKLVLISFDSTMRSNLSVGLPVDLLCYEKDTLSTRHLRRLGEGDGYMTGIRKQWGEGLRSVFETIAPPSLDD